jgi:hypothetical protein|tara:strand:+ start:1114 stop:2400 length:1287 start_codon:yes stop_codon:yes gene_type:complete
MVNTVWLFAFGGFMWLYSDPSMYVTESVIQKEFEKEGFVCSPLGYDKYYESALGYDECLLRLRLPTAKTVVLTDGMYSYVPFDPRLVRKLDGAGVDQCIYNPVGGGTSKKDLSEKAEQYQADILAALEDPSMIPAADALPFDFSNNNADDPLALNEFYGIDDAAGSGGDSSNDGAVPHGDTYYDGGLPFGGDSYDDPVPDGGDSHDDPVPDGGDSYDDPVPDVGDSYDDPVPDVGDSSDGTVPDVGDSSHVRRRLLQEDVEVEYEGLAELSGCNCNMIVISDDPEIQQQLRFYNETSDPNCIPVDSTNSTCTMNKARAVLLYRQFMAINDPCEFVLRNTPFQCIREASPPLTQRFSLAYANAGLLYGVVIALAINYMYATKKVTLETVDIEQLQKMASMNRVLPEEHSEIKAAATTKGGPRGLRQVST